MKTSSTKKEWVKLRQAAEFLDLKRDAIIEWIKRGWIAGRKLPNGQWEVDMSSIQHREVNK